MSLAHVEISGKEHSQSPGGQTQPYPCIVLALIHLLPVFLQPQPPEGERKDQKSFSTLTGVIYSTLAYTWLEQGDETFGCFQADSAL